MKNQVSHFIILGPYKGECTFFSIEHGWVTEDRFDLADAYPESILTVPLPTGATGVMAFTEESEPCGQYDSVVGSGVEGVENIFEKTY
jgi:hypothetical protein